MGHRRTGATASVAVPGAASEGDEESPRATLRLRELRSSSVGLVAATVDAFDDAAGVATLSLGRTRVEARLDAALSPAVVRTALARRERVIAQRDEDGWVLLGALRTAATPGVDEGDAFAIKARRITIAADHELSLATGTASLVLRAYGLVEAVAEDITLRARGLHKIVGRIIRLN